MKRKCIVICGPTASGKSAVADQLAEYYGVNSILVDSMQVYREIPEITNQKRDRHAHLCGIVPVSEKWTVARHRDSALDIISGEPSSNPQSPIILDAGTGMYLNSILLEIELAAGVSEATRKRAEAVVDLSEGNKKNSNKRREVRHQELQMSGGDNRGSIWVGTPRFDTYIVYLKPERPLLDSNIRRRTERISRKDGEGFEEARKIEEFLSGGGFVNPSVADAIGVRELRAVVRGEMSQDAARERIEIRTRQLSRRQMTWFDKLTRAIPGIESMIVEGYTGDSGEVREFCKEIIRSVSGISGYQGW